VTIDILHPGTNLESDEDANNNSIVLRLVYRDVAILLPGDIEADVERAMVRSGTYLRSTVLKVAHHGSKTSSSEVFLDAVDPQVAVISVGEGNRFGLPSRDVLERLDGALVYRTDENGTVAIASDGHKLWIETER
jgi:competence protein ComEC